MSHEFYQAANARLDHLDNVILHEMGVGWTDRRSVRSLREEKLALIDALIGEDARVEASLHIIRRSRSDGHPKIRGNEHWLMVEVPEWDESYAIWRNTGDLYRVGPDGAVEDDPIYQHPREP